MDSVLCILAYIRACFCTDTLKAVSYIYGADSPPHAAALTSCPRDRYCNNSAHSDPFRTDNKKSTSA